MTGGSHINLMPGQSITFDPPVRSIVVATPGYISLTTVDGSIIRPFFAPGVPQDWHVRSMAYAGTDATGIVVGR